MAIIMFNYISKFMLSFSSKATIVLLLINCCFSASINTPYFNFVSDLTKKNCTLPSQITVTFGANETIEAALRLCDSPQYLKFNAEVPELCNEIFVFLRDLSCSPPIGLSKLKVPLSSDVCTGFISNKAILPDGLLKHLADSFNCKLMCSGDLEAPCEVLLWSFLMQSQMKRSEIHESVTTKNSSVTETMLTSKLVEYPQIKKSDDKFQVGQVNLGDVGSESVKTPDAGGNLLATTLNLDNPKKPVAEVPDAAIKPDESVLKSNGQVIENTEIVKEKGEIEKAEMEKTDKIKNVIPIENTISHPANKDKLKETTLNGDLRNTNRPNPVPQGQPDQKIDADNEQQPKLPFEQESEIINNENSNPKNEDTKEAENLVPGKVDSDRDMPLIHTVPDNEIISDKKLDDSEKKVDNSAIVVAEKVSTNPPSGQTQVAESSSTGVSVSKSEKVPSPTSEVSVPVTPSLEKMEDEIPLPNDKDADQYNDLDNTGDLDGEYSKQEYGDGGIYEPTKNKEPTFEPPKSVEVPKGPAVPQIDEPAVPQIDDVKGFDGLSSRDSFGRGSDDIPVLTTFPDQEDSHFFFYFLSIVLILMAGYLIFHNKQKIIALIVEGRHERRRRSHGLGYKKLETK